MNGYVEKIFIRCVVAIIVLTLGFVVAINYLPVLICSLVYGGLVIAACIVTFYFISSKVNNALGQLSQIIDTLISGNELKHLSLLDEDILSRIKMQIITLNTHLVDRANREKLIKNDVAKVVSDINHQLKTPLTNINIYIELLESNDVSASDAKAYTQNIHSQVQKLNWLMESLMQMTKLEAGAIKLDKKTQPLINAPLKAISQLESKANIKNTQIELIADECIECEYDLMWISECIINIIDNAIKYSPDDSTIRVVVDSYELFCYIKVTDNSNPIPLSEINKIFNRFYRGNIAKNAQGVGLGLFIAREIVEQHGGYIKVKNINKGNEFGVYLKK